MLYTRSKNRGQPTMPVVGGGSVDKENKTSENQKQNLRRALSTPGPNLYFGPFGGGFLNNQGGQSGISAPKPVSGISLPMGVSLREQEQGFSGGEAWQKEEDDMIRTSCLRYGFNWFLICSAVSNVLGKNRSARQCLERWQALIQATPSIAKDVKHHDKVVKELGGEGPGALGRGWDEESLRGALEGIIDVGEGGGGGGGGGGGKKSGGGGGGGIGLMIKGGGGGAKVKAKGVSDVVVNSIMKKKIPQKIPGTSDATITLSAAHESHGKSVLGAVKKSGG